MTLPPHGNVGVEHGLGNSSDAPHSYVPKVMALEASGLTISPSGPECGRCGGACHSVLQRCSRPRFPQLLHPRTAPHVEHPSGVFGRSRLSSSRDHRSSAESWIATAPGLLVSSSIRFVPSRILVTRGWWRSHAMASWATEAVFYSASFRNTSMMLRTIDFDRREREGSAATPFDTRLLAARTCH